MIPNHKAAFKLVGEEREHFCMNKPSFPQGSGCDNWGFQICLLFVFLFCILKSTLLILADNNPQTEIRKHIWSEGLRIFFFIQAYSKSLAAGLCRC